MDELIQIKVKYFRLGNRRLGNLLANVISSLESSPSLQTKYVQQIIDLDNEGTLTFESLTPLKETIDKEIENERQITAEQQNRELNIKRKKVIFRIIDEYQRYIQNILSNKNDDPQFNSVVFSFATELSVKFMYVFDKLDELAIELANTTNIDSYLDRSLPYEEKGRIAYAIDKFIMNQDHNLSKDTTSLNAILADVRANNITPEFLRKMKSMLNDGAHSNNKYIEALPNYIKTLIKYYAIKFISMENIDLSNIESLDHIDYLLLTKDFLELNQEISSDNSLSVINSERFFWARYNSLEEPDKTNYNFAQALAMATFIVFKNMKDKLYRDNVREIVETDELFFISNLYTDIIKTYLNNDNTKKALLIELNKTYPKLMEEINNNLSCSEFEDFIKKLKVEEIKYLFQEVSNNPTLNNITDMIRYAINFKNKLKNIDSLKLDDSKYARINKLFKTISETSDITYLGFQLRNWLDSINLHELTNEELIELNKIDPKFVYSQLDYRTQIIYKKCEELQIPFRYYYRRFSNSKLEFLFKLYQYSEIEIPLSCLFLSNLQISTIFNRVGYKPALSLQPDTIKKVNKVMVAILSGSVESITNTRLISYLGLKNAINLSLYTRIPLKLAIKLKDTYLDAEFETTKLIIDYYKEDLDKINSIPSSVILCPYSRLTYLLNKNNGKLEELFNYPPEYFIEFNDIVDISNARIVKRLLFETGNPNLIPTRTYIIEAEEKKEFTDLFPNSIRMASKFYKMKNTNKDNLLFIKNMALESDIEKILIIFSDEKPSDLVGNEQYELSSILGASPDVFKHVYKVVNGDFINNPVKTAKDMRKILEIIYVVENVQILNEISFLAFGVPLDNLKPEDYLKFQKLPIYLLTSTEKNLVDNIRAYRLEQKLSTIPKKDGVKLLNASEVLLSYNRLTAFLIEGEEPNIQAELTSNVNLETLLYIDYVDICHLIKTYKELPDEQKSFMPKQTVLAIINYIASTGYKIDVHTFDTMEFLKLSFQELSRLTQQNQESSNKRSTL